MSNIDSNNNNKSNNNNNIKICIIGSGVIGLTVGIYLNRLGYKVTIISKCIPKLDLSHLLIDNYYASSKSGAHWFSFANDNEYLQQYYDKLSYHTFMGLATLYPNNTNNNYNNNYNYNPNINNDNNINNDSGVTIVRGHALFENDYIVDSKSPWWSSLVSNFHYYNNQELSNINNKTGKSYVIGYSYDTIMINVVKYLPFLVDLFKKEGGNIIIKELDNLYNNNELLDNYDFIINCSGLGSLKLVNDKNVYPCRGRTILVYEPSIVEIYREKYKYPIYILPRGDGTVVLGGTYQDNNWDLKCEDDSSTATQILNSCIKLEPVLKNSKILKHSAGLRPGRIGGPRFEWDSHNRYKNILHCYGHHGYGVQCSWGVAVETANKIKQRINNQHNIIHSKL